MTASARSWTLVEAGPLPPEGNMALDLGLLQEAVERGSSQPALRVYGWDPPTLSVGAKVDLPERVAARCAAAGVAIVRRATGGGCVLHDGDVTYSVTGPGEGRSVLEVYRWVAGGLIAALARLGLEATVAEHPATGRHLDCFAVATGADLAIAGRKVCGSAQLRRGGWFLQHGSLPIGDIRARTAELLGGSVDLASTCLERVRPGTTAQAVAEALVAGFTSLWGIEPRRRPPTEREWGSMRADELLRGAEWSTAERVYLQTL